MLIVTAKVAFFFQLSKFDNQNLIIVFFKHEFPIKFSLEQGFFLLMAEYNPI